MVQSNINSDKAAALVASLEQFTGTERYYRHFLRTLLTDGAKFLAEKAQCFWLMDIVASVQSPAFIQKADGLQTWTIVVNEDDSALVTCTARGEELYRQEVPMTDFILGRAEPFKFYAGPFSDGVRIVICLAGEI